MVGEGLAPPVIWAPSEKGLHVSGGGERGRTLFLDIGYTLHGYTLCSFYHILCHHSRLRARSPRGLTVHRTVRQYPRFRFALPEGGLMTGGASPSPTECARMIISYVANFDTTLPEGGLMTGGASPSPTECARLIISHVANSDTALPEGAIREEQAPFLWGVCFCYKDPLLGAM